ncbi:hypothetical protein ACFO9E_27060 [Streptomyces maoxianensis]|uniref:RHO protein GDP dissociation inhibitor n=1 Tax=Streptomyces maoxianensis TaxID=1459942 RepID=A0ABV9GFP2_9ACTN
MLTPWLRRLDCPMRAPLEEPIRGFGQLELVSVTLQAEGREGLDVSLPEPGKSQSTLLEAPFALKEGAEVRITLAFRLAQAVERLKFTVVRKRHGAMIGTTEVMLGSYRPGGPYEVVLPPERLPTGRLARDTYQVTGTFTNSDGEELGHEAHCFEITKEWE